MSIGPLWLCASVADFSVSRWRFSAPRRLLDQAQDLFDARHARRGTWLFSEIGPSSQKPECSECAQTRPFGARKFIVHPVANEPRVRHIDSQSPRGFQVDRRIGLGQTDIEREHRPVEM